jgi:predicted lipoprotein with Yx(FWY)xxD motif
MKIAAITAAAATSLVLVAACSSASKSTGASSAPAGAAAASNPAPASAPVSGAAATGTISTANTPGGAILVDGAGKSIYILTSDKPNGASACTAQCLQFWPAVAAPSPLPSGLAGITAKFGTFTDVSGSLQLTINGYPAYTFANDSAPGMVKGQGVKSFGGIWWLVTPSGSWVTTAAASSSNAAASSSSSKSGGGGYGY